MRSMATATFGCHSFGVLRCGCGRVDIPKTKVTVNTRDFVYLRPVNVGKSTKCRYNVHHH